jgi:hypothetical protein
VEEETIPMSHARAFLISALTTAAVVAVIFRVAAIRKIVVGS